MSKLSPKARKQVFLTNASALLKKWKLKSHEKNLM